MVRKLFLGGVVAGAIAWAAILGSVVIRPAPIDLWVVVHDKLVQAAEKVEREVRWCRQHPGKCDVEMAK